MKLELKNVVKSYGKQRALKFSSLSIPQCQSLVLIGPSGGGKSTLLRLLAGLEVPDAGTIVLNDHALSHEKEALRQYRIQLGIVFQSWNLFPHLTALENIVLPLYRVHGYTREQATERSLELLHRFDMQAHANKRPYALSGGQKQRVAIVRAIAAQPKMILLDEPTSALDPIMSYEVLELIRELKNEQRDLVLVTHHLPFARTIADYILFLAEGHIVEHGPAQQVLTHPHSEVVKHYMSRVWAFNAS